MSENTHLTPVWLIYADGRRLDTRHEGALRRIIVNDRLNGVSVFSLVFDSAELDVRASGLLTFGSRVSIHLGYKDDIEEVFAGDVLGFRALLPESGAARIEVIGCNVLYKLEAAEHCRSFEEKTPAGIIAGVIQSYSLEAEVEDFGAKAAFSASSAETDLMFILRLASAGGKDIYAFDSKVYVAAEITARKDEIIYEWGKNLIDFEAEENIRRLVSSYTFMGWDTQKNEAFSGEAAPKDIPLRVGGAKSWTDLVPGGGAASRSLCASASLRDAHDAKEAAAAALQKNSFRFARAQGSGEGNYKLRPGMRVTIKMAAEAFSGEYIAGSVCHRFDYTQGYRTDFSLKRNMSP
ncbi:MAG: hypothetical protein LBC67_00650 [Spirochaetales bacterium]|jgi:phage protein D|nr:hypothetical protein [Spirochaetales bacterium]